LKKVLFFNNTFKQNEHYYSLANTNRYQGLARGPIDHAASSVINKIANGIIDMGSVVLLISTIVSSELLPRVAQGTTQGSKLAYGIAVGGDADGIYGTGVASTDDTTRASSGAGQGVVIVTQGRCPARVKGGSTLIIGDELTASATDGVLEKATTADVVVAIALNDVADADTDIIAVDVQRGGIF